MTLVHSMYLKIIILYIFFCLINTSVFAETKGYPCLNPEVMELTDRGTITDTPCIVPEQQFLVEGGYQYQKLITSESLEVYPQAQIVYGLPHKLEIFLDVPSYNRPTNFVPSGLSPVNIGIKHEFAYGKKWSASLQGIVTIPSGSNAFGSPKISEVVNGIFAYELIS